MVLLQNKLGSTDRDGAELSDTGGVHAVPQLALQKIPCARQPLVKHHGLVSPPLPLSSLHSVLLQPSLGLNFHLSHDPLGDCNLVLGTVGRVALGLQCPSCNVACPASGYLTQG